MGPKWFVNVMRILAFIIIGVIIAFTIFEAAGLMGLGHLDEYSRSGGVSITREAPLYCAFAPRAKPGGLPQAQAASEKSQASRSGLLLSMGTDWLNLTKIPIFI